MKTSVQSHSKNMENQSVTNQQLKAKSGSDKTMSPNAIHGVPNATVNDKIGPKSAPSVPTKLPSTPLPSKQGNLIPPSDPSPSLTNQQLKAKSGSDKTMNPNAIYGVPNETGDDKIGPKSAPSVPMKLPSTHLPSEQGNLIPPSNPSPSLTANKTRTTPNLVSQQGNFSPQSDPSTPFTPAQMTPTGTNLDPASLKQNSATIGTPNGAVANANAKPMLKPIARKGKHPTSNSPSPKKRCIEIQVTATTTRGMYFAIYKGTKSFNGQPAYMGDFVNNLDSINQTPGNNFVGVFTLPSGVAYDRVAVAVLEVQDGEDPNAAVVRQGKLFSAALERITEPFKKGNTVGMKTICNFAYIENDQPKYLNAVVGDNNASNIIAQTYQDYIEDGTFWEGADEIIETYFDDSIDPELVKKKIRYASRNFLA